MKPEVFLPDDAMIILTRLFSSSPSTTPRYTIGWSTVTGLVESEVSTIVVLRTRKSFVFAIVASGNGISRVIASGLFATIYFPLSPTLIVVCGALILVWVTPWTKRSVGIKRVPCSCRALIWFITRLSFLTSSASFVVFILLLFFHLTF